MDLNDFNMSEVRWQDIAADIKGKNPNLFKAIESSSLKNDCTLIKCRYPFGAKIVENGVIQLPHRSGIAIPITSSEIDRKLAKMLSYSQIPLAVLFNKACEVYVERNNHTIPLKLLYPGRLFGLFETVNTLCGLCSEAQWCVSSGARNLFMLPKISDKTGYQRIKKELNLEITPPRNVAEHWEVFVKLSNHKDHNENWYSEVYFFTNKWFEKWENNVEAMDFYKYIFKEDVIQRHYTNINMEFDLSWQNFSADINSRNFRPRPYLLDTIKYLFAMSKGMLPGFKVADISDVVAPINLLQKIYTDVYGLKAYLPTVMHPFNLMKDANNTPIYYSLSFPSIVEGLPCYRSSASDIISNLRELKRLINIANSELNPASYEYFHSEIDIYQDLMLSSDIPLQDSSFLKDKEVFPDRVFCATAPFFSGCIRVAV